MATFDSSIIQALLKNTRLPLPYKGEKIEMLTVLGEFGYVVSGIPRLTVLVQCKCGKRKFMYVQYLRSGRAISCGCAPRAKKKMEPGTRMTDSPLYRVYSSMKQRCYDPKCTSYKYYGARGITICDEWRRNFRAFERWAKEHGYRKELSIDRIDNNGPYAPENCRFVTPAMQMLNTRYNRRITAFGETKTVKEWEDDPRCVTKERLLYARLDSGMSPEEAITKPPHPTLTAFNETKTLLDWIKDPRCCVSYKILWQRLHHGAIPEDAIAAKRCPYPR